MTPKRLTPHEAVRLWYDLAAHRTGEQGVIAFANALADRYLPAAVPVRKPLSDLGLANFAYNALRRAGYEFCDQIQHMSVEQLQEIHNIGPTAAREIWVAMEGVKA